jgi:hypothetical protein
MLFIVHTGWFDKLEDSYINSPSNKIAHVWL